MSDYPHPKSEDIILKEFAAIDAGHIRYVTINGTSCGSMAEVEMQHRKMKNDLSNLCKPNKPLEGIRFYAILEVTWRDGYFPHWHCVVGGNVGNLENKLHCKFPGFRQVNVQPILSSDKNKEIEKVVGYGFKRKVAVSIPLDRYAELLMWIRANKGLKTLCFVRGKLSVPRYAVPS